MARGKKHSAATRGKIRRAQLGKNNSFYGKRHSMTTRRKISSLTAGKKNPMYGKHHTPAAIAKIRLAAKRRRIR